MSNTSFERFVDVDIEGASLRAAGLAAKALRESVALRSRASLALSGGSTPGRFFELLAGQDLPWDAVHIFWADERLVARDSPESNYRLAQKYLLSRAPIPQGNIHPMAGKGTPEEQASAYEVLLREVFPDENPPAFDVIHLGLGGDGHTASLFPGQPALSERERWVVPVEYARALPPLPRLTLTLPVLNAARLVIVLAAGLDKARLVERILTGQGRECPASLVRPAGRLVWIVG